MTPVLELLEIYGSPLYVYEGDKLLHTLHQIRQAIPYPRTSLHFASVTNGNIALLRLVKAANWG
jgi:diaminopimelate decarboxylase